MIFEIYQVRYFRSVDDALPLCRHHIILFLQAELRQQLQRDGKEPIYQNLPAHDRMLVESVDSATINDVDDDVDVLNTTNTTNYEKDITEDESVER